jgi:hypothetical protein
MIGPVRRVVAIGIVVGAAALAAASVGNGSLVASQPVLVIPIASGSGSASDALQNTTSSSLQVDVQQDVSCASGLSFTIAGGLPFALAGSGSKNVQLECPAGSAGMQRCLLHAVDATTGAALADFLQVCLVGGSPTLTPSMTTVDFTATPISVGATASLPLTLHNTGSDTAGTLYLQTSDLDGNFGFGLPCNLPAPFCDAAVATVGPAGDAVINVRCTPRAAGLHTASLYVATDSAQVLAQPVTLRCIGSAATVPVLDVNPPEIDVTKPIDVVTGSASAVVHLTNVGSGTLLIDDVRPAQVVLGASTDWHYTASGHCSGSIPPACQLGPGDVVDLDVTFDPSAIGARDASLVVSYTDTTNRSRAIPLSGRGGGATLQLVDTLAGLDFGVVPVGHPSSLAVAVANHGTRDTTATLALMPTGAPFSLTPATSVDVPPTGTTRITVTCAPIAAGSASTAITANAPDAFASPEISLTATCTGSTQPLFATPSAVAFGEVRTTAAAVTRTVQLESTGGALTLTGQPMLETANLAIAVGALSSTTTPATFDIRVDPIAEGSIGNAVTVTDSANETIRIPITGQIVKPSYSVPSSLDLGTFCINQPTTPTPLSLISTGTATIGLSAPSFGSPRSPFDLSLTAPAAYPTDLLPGQSATVLVTPQPQASATALTDVMTWTTDVETAGSATTALTARFIDSGGAIAPSALDFGPVLVHVTQDNGQGVVIQNCNGSVLDLDPPTIKAPFSIDSPTLPSQLQPNDTTTFRIGFHPTRLGTFTDTLLISSQQLASPLMVQLVGEAVEGEPLPDAGSSTPPSHPDDGCGCHAAGVGAGWPLALALTAARRRRRRGSSSPR